jgi:putative oxidoreductase
MNTPGLISRLRRAYEIFILAASTLRSPLLLTLRLYWGWAFFETGKGKLMNLGATSEFFASLGIPLPALNAAVAGSVECFGGLLLLIGLASRLTALPLMFTMIVAYLTADLAVVRNIFADPEAFVTAAPFLFLLAATVVFVFGPGAFSIDRLISRKFSAPASKGDLQPQLA